jgi:hypothetical protein
MRLKDEIRKKKKKEKATKIIVIIIFLSWKNAKNNVLFP